MANQSAHDPLVTSGQIAPPSARSTGLVFAAVGAVVAVLFRHTPAVWITALAVGGVFLVLALAAPGLLGPLNRAWFRFSLLLNRIVNPVVMLLMFVIVFLPMGLLMRLWRDPLVRRRQPGRATYWVARDPAEPGHSMRNQF
jgi:hypothetical protein